jgi:putative transposase
VAVARVLQVTRQAIYRVPKTRPPAARRSARPADETDAAIVDVALANQTDGYRMVTALVVRKLGRAVNRKRVLRVMRERRLIQRRPKTRSSPPARLLPGHPAQRVWHLDMTSVWVAEHGWCYLMAAIDCCTREIVGWHPELRCRAPRRSRSSSAPLPSARSWPARSRSARTTARRSLPAPSSSSSRDSGSRIAAAATATPRARRSSRAGSPSSRSAGVRLHEFETLDQAGEIIAAHIDRYQHRPHSRLNYRTPAEVAQTWDDALGDLQAQAA